MKLYTCFLKLTKELKDSILGISYTGITLDWKYDKDEDLWGAFYGWTGNKELMKLFKKTRNPDLFIYSSISDTRKIDQIMERYMDLKIEKYKLEKKSKHNWSKSTETIVMTWFEYLASTDKEFLIDKFLFDNVPSIDPFWFSPKMLNILEQLGFSYIFYNYLVENLPFGSLYYMDDIPKHHTYLLDINSRIDNYWNISNFKTGNQYVNEFGINAKIPRINQLHCFIKLFAELLIT